MTSTETGLSLRDGAKVDVTYEWSRYYPSTFDHPEEGGFEGITEVWAWAKDAKGEAHYVEVTQFINEDDMDFLCAQIGTDYE